jgi:ribosomal protein S18 acetylase RimI-like enzyme
MIASITELCTADHRGDLALVAGWTRNKTPESVAGMLANPHLALFIAEVDGTVGAVGAVNGADAIGLNYVSPAFRFRGLSRALLAHMEADMAARGTEIGRLVSTQTALRFYRAHGWQDAGPPESGHNVDGYPMTKRLSLQL